MKEHIGFDVVQATASDEVELESLVEQIWREVVTSINHVLEADSTLGFTSFELRTNPSIAEIELSLDIVSAALSSLMKSDSVSYETSRNLLNCEQSLFHIRRTFLALRHKSKDEYDGCIRALKTQRQ